MWCDNMGMLLITINTIIQLASLIIFPHLLRVYTHTYIQLWSPHVVHPKKKRSNTSQTLHPNRSKLQSSVCEGDGGQRKPTKPYQHQRKSCWGNGTGNNRSWRPVEWNELSYSSHHGLSNQSATVQSKLCTTACCNNESVAHVTPCAGYIFSPALLFLLPHVVD